MGEARPAVLEPSAKLGNEPKALRITHLPSPVVPEWGREVDANCLDTSPVYIYDISTQDEFL